MKLGLNLFRNMATTEYFRFAKQMGCSHLVFHLTNYFTKSLLHGTDGEHNWGVCEKNDEVWTLDGLKSLRKSVEDSGLVIEALENFNPLFWYDILLDGPKKYEQMDQVKRIIANVGKAGIPIFGYNFSIAGVWGHSNEPKARGYATTVCFNHEDGGSKYPIPKGDVWNMTYDPDAPKGYIAPVSKEELWERLEWFLNEILPVAEEYGVKMAAHPDDPPMETIRGHARLVYQPSLYQKLIDINPSPSNCLEFCMGTIQEMSEGNIYDAIEQYAQQDRIAYVHFRNVKGKVPNYVETFVDEGDIDMLRALRLLKKGGFDGVLIPDHSPAVDCPGSWYAGNAYALGYMKAAIQQVESE